MILRSGLLTIFSTLSLLLKHTRADVSFTSPAAGATISGSDMTVTFADSATSPSISTFTSFTLQLCAGGNTAGTFTPIYTFTSTGTFSPLSQSFTLPASALAAGASSPSNAYFLRTISVVSTGGTITNYSPRFTISSMTGQFPANIITALSSVSGTTGPATENNVAAPAAAASSADGGAAGGSYALAYTMQTGPVRYAPMASMVPTKITQKGNGRQYATSAYTPWPRSGASSPNAQTTQTDPFTWATVSMEATIAAAAQPTTGGGLQGKEQVLGKRDDMEVFLDRWKD